ncbi:lipid-A-disaccharide synthase [Pararhizobium antarcticum]|uniref:Lipid-A-disaccharide synthase n=1 Tax=Pararhizobium antarcticum TaxID=1798805 RepID=A0A657LKA1_9HYPH|nr:lipid-A-disaccharide synthase [Pararhizobium antarcticum]OJF89968.1 lipid-A-disaccharide synthase [Pararhizobium antarcticum]OJF93199.1 lipid-A-disaccharide synthase [Rhizobium sp. 58]
MTAPALKVAIIAGEVSGDLLGGDLVLALRQRLNGPLELVGVGGEALEAQGLRSLFDYSELSIMGLSQVLARLPNLIRRIRLTTAAIIAAKPDVLVIIDSPDFTHRVAKAVRKALPDLPVVNYVCPSVWAWKPERAPRMRAYVDHVLAVLPFEPQAMIALDGPETTYVGHRLASDPALLGARQTIAARRMSGAGGNTTCLILPGSRSSEIKRLLPLFGETMKQLAARNPDMRFLLPTVPRQEQLVRAMVADWDRQPVITTGTEEKWKAFAQADAAIAASGTVILELALAGIPAISAYKVDWLFKLMAHRITIWTAALPNLIADYPVVPEYVEVVRPGNLARWVERLVADTTQRRAMLEGYDLVWERMKTRQPPGQKAAGVIMDLLSTKKPGR